MLKRIKADFVPQATVRMVINYKKTQKTVLRVSPRVPLADHLQAICEKCEFDVESTVLLRDVHSVSPLDLSCSLNDYAIREVYARDTRSKSSTPTGQNCQFGCYSFIACSAGQSASPGSPVSPSHSGIQIWKLISADRSPPTRDSTSLSLLFLFSVSKQRQNSKGRRKQRPF